MEPLYTGKTKDVYQTDDKELYLLKFKDAVTGTDGVFDPGANTVGLTIEGAGKSGLKMTTRFFELLKEHQIPTHHVSSDIDASAMIVKKATVFGKGLEVICRFRAVGSFFRRYGAYCEEGQPLNDFVEFTIKDDEREDPPISRDALVMLGILTSDEHDRIKEHTVRICRIVKEELGRKGLDLYDIKLEFGKDSEGKIMLIDEISGGNMRVYQNGEYIEPLKLEQLFLR